MLRQTAIRRALCALLLSSIVGAVAPVHAAGDLNRTYDWTVRVQTEELQHYFEYKNSTLRPLDRINVDYYVGDDDTTPKPYEKLWYHDGQPLGLERLQTLTVTQGENICILITHKTAQPAPGELKAAANAILRIWLDAQVNKNQLVVVKVPGASLQGIANELVAKQKLFVVPESNGEAPLNTTMTLLLESESDGTQINLAYL